MTWETNLPGAIVGESIHLGRRSFINEASDKAGDKDVRKVRRPTPTIYEYRSDLWNCARVRRGFACRSHPARCRGCLIGCTHHTENTNVRQRFVSLDRHWSSIS